MAGSLQVAGSLPCPGRTPDVDFRQVFNSLLVYNHQCSSNCAIHYEHSVGLVALPGLPQGIMMSVCTE
eukprot:1198414-Rhodomonas_salina.2